jgi:hypothetical protein
MVLVILYGINTVMKARMKAGTYSSVPMHPGSNRLMFTSFYGSGLTDLMMIG